MLGIYACTSEIVPSSVGTMPMCMRETSGAFLTSADMDCNARNVANAGLHV